MMNGNFPVEQLSKHDTPYYYYDMDILRETLAVLRDEPTDANWHVHYAIKACATDAVLQTIAANGF